MGELYGVWIIYQLSLIINLSIWFFQNWVIWKYSAQTSSWLWVFQTLFFLHDPGTFKFMLRCSGISGPALAQQVSKHNGNKSGPGSHFQSRDMWLRHMSIYHTQNSETPIQPLIQMAKSPQPFRTSPDVRGSVQRSRSGKGQLSNPVEVKVSYSYPTKQKTYDHFKHTARGSFRL